MPSPDAAGACAGNFGHGRGRANRTSMRPHVVALAVLAAACDAPASELAIETEASAAPIAEALPIPDTREGFLRELAPLPSDAVQVSYEVEGPGGLSGTLEVLLQPGGLRREHWILDLPVPGGESESIEGESIQTSDFAWTGAPSRWTVERAPFGALADGYLGLAAEDRRAVIDSIRSFRDRLADARREHPGNAEEILGVSCLAVRLAAQELCVWEETGLPLRYAGNAFTLRALAIDLDPAIDAEAFAVPSDVEHAAPAPDLDPQASLQRLAERNYAELGPLLHPGLRLPLG